jgi:hypothetical protein
LRPAHSLHCDIRNDGGGAFSHWGRQLWLSSSDGTSPITNGRAYHAVLLPEEAPAKVAPPTSQVTCVDGTRSLLIRLDPAGMAHVDGHAYALVLPEGIPPGDSPEKPSRSWIRLFEDGVELRPAHSPHCDIRNEGRGAFSHWGGQLWFSSSDGTSPIANGRIYQVYVPQQMLVSEREGVLAGIGLDVSGMSRLDRFHLARELFRAITAGTSLSDSPCHQGSPRPTSTPPLVIHAGYPKTATSTFQRHVFPHHPDIHYLGKDFPSFRFVDERLYDLIDELFHASTINFGGPDALRVIFDEITSQSQSKCILLSTESLIHPAAFDAGIVASRIMDAFGECKILLTIREQISSILSFYFTHGQFGQYLYIDAKDEDDNISYPISFQSWINWQKKCPDRNYIGLMDYNSVIRHYVSVFGRDNVCVLLYEQFRDDPDGYARDMAAFLGIDAPSLRELMMDRHENPSPGRAAPWRGEDAGSDEIISELRHSYRVGNAQLAREWPLPLEAFGYTL